MPRKRIEVNPVLKATLEEELQRLERMQEKVKCELAALPKGTLQKRIVRNRAYAYLKYYESGKTKQKYIGPYESEKVLELAKQIERRKALEKSMRRAAADRAIANKGLKR